MTRPLISRTQQAIRDRAAYRRTVREIRNLPIALALDVGLYPGDAEATARHAVYGR